MKFTQNPAGAKAHSLLMCGTGADFLGQGPESTLKVFLPWARVAYPIGLGQRPRDPSGHSRSSGMVVIVLKSIKVTQHPNLTLL